MRVLFYINECPNEILTSFSVFLKTFLKSNDKKIVVICENQANKKTLKNILVNYKNQFTIINIYSKPDEIESNSDKDNINMFIKKIIYFPTNNVFQTMRLVCSSRTH